MTAAVGHRPRASRSSGSSPARGGGVGPTDHDVGRLLHAVKELPDADNTLVIYIVGDNGASGEGGPDGTLNADFSEANDLPKPPVPGANPDATRYTYYADATRIVEPAAPPRRSWALAAKVKT